jgi:hypothetical protein
MITAKIYDIEIGSKVLRAVVIKHFVFFDITPCILVKSTSVSEEYIGSIFRVEE